MDGGPRLSVLHAAATVSLAGLAGVAFVLVPGPVRRTAVGGAALLAVAGALYALFGDGDWTAGGRHRRHATFLLAFVVFAGGGTMLVEQVADPLDAVGLGLQVLALVYGFAVAGWLAYLDGSRTVGRWLAGVRAAVRDGGPDAGRD